MTEFTKHNIETTTGAVNDLLKGINKNFGFVPNLFTYMAEAPTTIEAYLSLMNLIGKTSFTPAQQQIALLSASTENECDFCIVAHRAIGKMKGANAQTLSAISKNEEVANESDRALSKFTRAVVKKRGNVNESDINEFLNAGFSKQQIFEIILIVTVKTLSNYTNHITKPEINNELINML